MLKGNVKWYNRKKGYGFIAGDDGQDYFVHYSKLPEGCILKDNDRVEFVGMETPKGFQAQEVEILPK